MSRLLLTPEDGNEEIAAWLNFLIMTAQLGCSNHHLENFDQSNPDITDITDCGTHQPIHSLEV